jgi:hypothetical protein
MQYVWLKFSDMALPASHRLIHGDLGIGGALSIRPRGYIFLETGIFLGWFLFPMIPIFLLYLLRSVKYSINFFSVPDHFALPADINIPIGRRFSRDVCILGLLRCIYFSGGLRLNFRLALFCLNFLDLRFGLRLIGYHIFGLGIIGGWVFGDV